MTNDDGIEKALAMTVHTSDTRMSSTSVVAEPGRVLERVESW